MGRTFRKGGREAEHNKFRDKKEVREKAEKLKRERKAKRADLDTKEEAQ